MRLAKYALLLVVLGVIFAGCIPKPPPAPFKLGAGIWHTFGTTPGATECHYARVKANGTVVSDVHSTKGARMVEVQDTDREFVTSGCQNWVRSMGDGDRFKIGAVEPNPQRLPGGSDAIKQISGDGDYRVGPPYGYYSPSNLDASYGTYQLQNGQTCRWERVVDWTGEGVVARGNASGDGVIRQLPGSVTVETTDAGIRLFGCGLLYWYGFPLR